MTIALANLSSFPLVPCYLVHGTEPLLIEEAVASIRAIAQKNNYTENKVLDVRAQFDWDQLLNSCDNYSLFAEQRMIELRIHTSLGKTGSKVLFSFLQNQPDDILLLITAGKLEQATLKSRWAMHVQQKGAVYAAKPLSAAKWPQWATERLRQAGFKPTEEACHYFIRYYEGNLLAANQCLSKLQALLPKGPLELEQIKPFIDDDARFSIYELVDSAIGGHANRTIRILSCLKKQSTEPVLVLWAVTKEIRTLLKVAYDLQNGANFGQITSKHGIWKYRLPLIRSALDRMPATYLEKLIKKSHMVDIMIKGIAPGCIWSTLQEICLNLAGVQIVNTTMEDAYL